MTSRRRTVSLVAERAVRLLRDRNQGLDSRALAEALLATRTADEQTAKKILETAFGDDPRVVYRDALWNYAPVRRDGPIGEAPVEEADRVLILLDGVRPSPRQPFRLSAVAAIRVRDELVTAACGGEPLPGVAAQELCSEFLEVVDQAIPVVHDPPGGLPALENWLEEPLPAPVSLRELARDRLGLRLHHELPELAARLGLSWTESEDWQERASLLDACLDGLRRPGETLEQMRRALREVTPIAWSRYAFDRRFLRSLPRTAGTYRFIDAEGRDLYVGKAKNLHRRVASYFQESRPRTARVQRLLDHLHRIEFETLQSELEAMLQEASEIRKRNPSHNVQRQIHLRGHHRSRLRSIMIVEPAAAPLVFRAYLIGEGRLIAKVGLGPRGGGLRRLERILRDHFFSVPAGPAPVAGPDVDLELIARWLAEHRDKVVAFDPTTLRQPEEVTARLRTLLNSRDLFEPDGSPILIR